jgi:hypothetical protein
VLTGVRHGLPTQQPAYRLDGLGEQPDGLARLDARVGQIARRPRAQAERDATGRQLVERGRRHGDVHRVYHVRAHRHRRDPRRLRRRQHDGSRAERVAQEQVARHPQGLDAGRLRGPRLLAQPAERVAPVEGDTEAGHVALYT